MIMQRTEGAKEGKKCNASTRKVKQCTINSFTRFLRIIVDFNILYIYSEFPIIL
jgi:hypothetical protein